MPRPRPVTLPLDALSGEEIVDTQAPSTHAIPQTIPRNTSIRRLPLIAVTYACMFVFGAILLLMGSLLPSLQLSYARAGNLGSFPLAGILAATVLVGPLLDRFGVKPALAAALLLVSAALAIMPALHSYPELATAALAYGAGGGVLNTATNALVSDLSASARGSALNMLGFYFSLGAVSAPLLMSLAGRGLSPWAALRVLAAATAVILVPVLAFQFPPPSQAKAGVRDLLRVLNRPLVWFFGVVLFFESGSENCMFVWSSKLTADLLHIGAERANLSLLALSSSLGAGRLLAVLWLRWLSARSLILASAAAAVLGAVMVSGRAGLISMLAGFVVLGLGLSAIFPTTLGLAGDRFTQTGTVFGAIMAVALVGGTAGPTAGAWLAMSGPEKILLLPIVSSTVVASLVLIIARRASGIPEQAGRV
jgi:MFS transporter, FHS family, glucose/mannose:H+ symporter